MKLKVIYKSEEKIKEFLDKFITAKLKELGFEETGSGYNFETSERDISFEHKLEK